MCIVYGRRVEEDAGSRGGGCVTEGTIVEEVYCREGVNIRGDSGSGVSGSG